MAIEMSKGGQTPSLPTEGELHINVNWQGLGGMSKTGIDVDLACLFDVERFGQDRGLVQALGGNFGDFNRQPYVKLERDDRTGAAADGENMRINLGATGKIKQMLVFAYIYQGADSWVGLNAVATVTAPNGQQFSMPLDSPEPGKKFCVITHITKPNGTKLRAANVQGYFSSHREVDRAYDWDLNWAPASK